MTLPSSVCAGSKLGTKSLRGLVFIYSTTLICNSETIETPAGTRDTRRSLAPIRKGSQQDNQWQQSKRDIVAKARRGCHPQHSVDTLLAKLDVVGSHISHHRFISLISHSFTDPCWYSGGYSRCPVPHDWKSNNTKKQWTKTITHVAWDSILWFPTQP